MSSGATIPEAAMFDAAVDTVNFNGSADWKAIRAAGASILFLQPALRRLLRSPPVR